MSESSTEVTIVGAGPTGLLLAYELSRRGVQLRLIDRSEGPSTQSRAIGIQARTLELFENLGLLEPFLEHGLMVKGLRVYQDMELRKQLSLAFEDTPEVPYPFLLVLEQRVTESLLLKALAAKELHVERGVELTRLSQSDSEVQGWLKTAEGSEHLRCSYLIGCDGAHSTVRRLSDIAMPGATYDRVYSLGDVDIEWELPHDEIYRFRGATEELVVVPLPGESRYRVTLWQTAPRPVTSDEVDFGVLVSPPTLASLQERVAKLVPVETRLTNPRSLLSYRMGHRVAERFSQGRVFLAGDSAHLLPPNSAQGMNVGLQDAYNLAWKMAMVVQGDSPPQLLDSYDAERRPTAQAAVEELQPRSRDATIDDGKFAHLESQLLFARWSQLSVSYLDSPIVNNIEGQGLLAGERAPDGVLQTPEGPTRLFELFSEPYFHLLYFGQDEALDETVRLIEEAYGHYIHVIKVGQQDPTGRLAQAYHAQGSHLFLIRPDGYVAARVGVESGPEILGFLSSYLAPNSVAIG